MNTHTGAQTHSRIISIYTYIHTHNHTQTHIQTHSHKHMEKNEKNACVPSPGHVAYLPILGL